MWCLITCRQIIDGVEVTWFHSGLPWGCSCGVPGGSDPLPSSWDGFPGLFPKTTAFPALQAGGAAPGRIIPRHGPCGVSDLQSLLGLCKGLFCVWPRLCLGAGGRSRPLKCFYCHLSLTRSFPDKQQRSHNCCLEWGEQMLRCPHDFPEP